MLTFSEKTKTADGFLIFVGGICNVMPDTSGVGDWVFGDFSDPVRVDERLCELVSRAFPDALALGASIRVSESGPVTGGVIGAPGAALPSGYLERLGSGLWLLTAPSGPGAVFSGGSAFAEEVRDRMDLFAPKRAAFLSLCHLLRGAKTRLVVSDGTGEGSYPALLAL